MSNPRSQVPVRRPALLLPTARFGLPTVVLGALALSSILAAAPAPGSEPPASSRDPFPQGTAVGDVGPSSAVIWTRTPEPVPLELRTWPEAEPGAFRTFEVRPSGADTAEIGTVQLTVDDLEPGTAYRYRFMVLGPADGSEEHSVEGPSIEGRFSTAPAADQPALPTFAVAGDLGGQALCRHAERGYAIFRALLDAAPDFLVANGDMIYADNPCPPLGPERDGAPWPNVPGNFPGIGDVDWSEPGAARAVIDAHWRYNREDPHHRAFLAAVPYFAQWDDHEVINDFGAPWAELPMEPGRPGYPQLVADARRAFFDWNPIRRHPEEPERIYRSFRWGEHLELFLLDGRSYRSANDLPDTPAHRKVLLGEAQRRWLVEGLAASTATWKIVSSDVPLSIPTGWRADRVGRDAFANGTADDFSQRTGFERELLELLAEIDRADIRNLVVVVTDVHLAANLRYARDFDGDGEPLVFHELVNGPLNAYTAPTLAQLDPTLAPTILYAEGGFFNFALLHLEAGADGRIRLVSTIRGEDGRVRHGSRLRIEPEPASTE